MADLIKKHLTKKIPKIILFTLKESIAKAQNERIAEYWCSRN